MGYAGKQANASLDGEQSASPKWTPEIPGALERCRPFGG